MDELFPVRHYSFLESQRQKDKKQVSFKEIKGSDQVMSFSQKQYWVARSLLDVLYATVWIKSFSKINYRHCVKVESKS